MVKSINIPGAINSASWETQPSLSADGKTLYFIREIKGSGAKDNSDIFVSHLREDGNWDTPKRLPEIINTPCRRICSYSSRWENFIFCIQRTCWTWCSRSL